MVLQTYCGVVDFMLPTYCGVVDVIIVLQTYCVVDFCYGVADLIVVS